MTANGSCFDLTRQSLWRVFYSEDHIPGSRVDPRNLELRGPGGSAIYPADGTELCAYSPRRGLWSRLETFGRVVQRGDFELTIRFPADRLADVAALLKCYRKKALSVDALATLQAAGEKGRARRLESRRNEATAPGSDARPARGRSIAPQREERVMPEKATRSEEGGTDEPW